MKNIKLLFSAFAFLILAAGCKKSFLERIPLDAVTIDNFYQTEGDLRKVTGALYGSPWFDYNDKVLLFIGDALSGNLGGGNAGSWNSFAVSSGETGVNEGWRSLYRIIAHCNMNIIYFNEKSAPSISQESKNAALAELKFLRATSYFNLVQLWGAVPIIEDNRTLVDMPSRQRNTIKDIYRFIINDLRFASENLRVAKDPGRVNKWSAEGMLAKVYLTRSGLKDDGTGNGNGMRTQLYLDSAKFYAGDVCKNSGLALMPNYTDLFKIANNNNDESLFALQWVGSTTYGIGNSTQAYYAAEPKLTGVGDGWGAANTVSIDLFSNKYVSGDTRRKATYMQSGDVYPELLKASGGYTVTSTTPNLKKYIVGTPADNDGKGVFFLSTGINTYMLRLADVYLLYAEAICGNSSSTADADALLYFNKVHTRAGLTARTGSLTITDILAERRIELAFEGQYWFDLLRQHDINPTQTINLLANQDRGTVSYNSTTNTTVYTSKKVAPSEAAFKLPYPEADVVTNPLLRDAPVPYYK